MSTRIGLLRAALLPLFFAAAATGQVAATAPLYERLTQRDGLSDSTVYSLAQDKSGLLWLATGAGGVNLYDGHRFRVLHRGGTDASPSHDDIAVVRASRDGGVWIGTWGGGLERFDPASQRFERLNPDRPPRRIQALVEARDGTLWIGSLQDGLFRLRPGATELEAIPRGGTSGRERIWSLAEDRDGIWVASDADLSFVPTTGGTPRSVALEVHPRTLLVDGDVLWIGGEDRLFRLDLGGNGDVALPVATGLTTVNALFRLPDRLLVGTVSGLRAVDPATGAPRPPLPGRRELVVSDSNVRDVLQDRTGLLWLATREAGLLKMRAEPPAFSGALLPDTAGTIVAVCELAPDRLLLGTRRGLWRAERRDGGFVVSPLAGGAGLFVTSLVRRPDGRVWIGSREGLFELDPASGEIARSPLGSDLQGANLDTLLVDPRGRLWISVWGAGLRRFDLATGETLRLDVESNPPLPQDEVLSFAVDDEGILWVGDRVEGIVRIDLGDGGVERFEPSLGLPEGQVRALATAPGNALWIGSDFGVARMNTRTREIVRLALDRDRPTARVLGITPDLEGNAWVGTSQGILRIAAGDSQALWFDEGDGLPTSEFVQHAFATGPSGRIYFGGVGGFVDFDPAAIDAGRPPPELSLLGVLVDGRPALPSEGRLELRPGERELTLRYASLDFRRPEKNRFRFRLIGLDPDWRPVTDAWEATFMNLEPGEYLFEVKGSNSNGVWSETPVALAIRVLPPWWRTWWGRGLLWSAGLLVVVGWHGQRTQRIRERNRELESRVAEKTEALRRANDDLARAARTDFLTGLPNRRGVMAALEALPADATACLAIADLDDFKQVNDRFGHEIGDRVLREVAAKVAALVRQSDLVARWGGEELVFLFPGLDVDKGRDTLERALRAVAELIVASPSGPVEITLTAGAAGRRPGESIDAWLGRADAALYAGKARGKNQVVIDDATL